MFGSCLGQDPRIRQNPHRPEILRFIGREIKKKIDHPFPSPQTFIYLNPNTSLMTSSGDGWDDGILPLESDITDGHDEDTLELSLEWDKYYDELDFSETRNFEMTKIRWGRSIKSSELELPGCWLLDKLELVIHHPDVELSAIHWTEILTIIISSRLVSTNVLPLCFPPSKKRPIITNLGSTIIPLNGYSCRNSNVHLCTFIPTQDGCEIFVRDNITCSLRGRARRETSRPPVCPIGILSSSNEDVYWYCTLAYNDPNELLIMFPDERIEYTASDYYESGETNKLIPEMGIIKFDSVRIIGQSLSLTFHPTPVIIKKTHIQQHVFHGISVYRAMLTTAQRQTIRVSSRDQINVDIIHDEACDEFDIDSIDAHYVMLVNRPTTVKD